MDYEYMRHWLLQFCNDQWSSGKRCSGCVLGGPACRCGRGVHFGEGQGMTDQDILEAYDIAAESRFKNPEIEPVPCGDLLAILGGGIA